jgi:dTDP-4-dehydrorhamnose 3,5-epimerase
MFKLLESSIPSCYQIIPRISRDKRGKFIKTFHYDFFFQHGLNTVWAEEYYSTSRKGVLRGLHFQVPPHDHTKMVYCSEGEVFDVVLDLRIGSPTFGKFESFLLSAHSANCIYIPKGLAHGFYTISSTATIHYMVETVYSPEHDKGVLWSSVDIPWPVKNPIISTRDSNFPHFSKFNSLFAFSTISNE